MHVIIINFNGDIYSSLKNNYCLKSFIIVNYTKKFIKKVEKKNKPLFGLDQFITMFETAWLWIAVILVMYWRMRVTSGTTFESNLKKTHIKKVFFLVVGPLRGLGGGKPPWHLAKTYFTL